MHCSVLLVGRKEQEGWIQPLAYMRLSSQPGDRCACIGLPQRGMMTVAIYC